MMLRVLLTSLSLLLPLAAAPETGFTALFNGTDLTGWTKVGGNGQFSVEDGCIVGNGVNVGSNTFLRTNLTAFDFDFRFEMKFDDLSGNSGAMFRAELVSGRTTGYQCEHDNSTSRAWTAGLYDEARRGWLFPAGGSTTTEAARDFTAQGKQLFRADGWNQIRVLCQGSRVRIWLNGQPRSDYTETNTLYLKEGFFALQVHSGASCKVRWRNLRFKAL
ncbi:DUF1080 domain-containing protein [Luteolibacter arcticus]|uniref:DUF1080 domain-containing protein n=1 Tax=Luteolibacter arcticus TaxID=1581411 RepID=A0ABT3GEP8_9BACT|nr:DUF1080 domain-containing protein [Luteolibacter arcticus]MCW1921768.1 DUF1080 domain-containing protein [Luteolibacter arcticus]